MRFLSCFIILCFFTGLPAYSQAYDPFDHSDRAMNALLGWGALSIATGTGMLFSGNARVQYAGIQNIAWGAIDSGIAFWGKSGNVNDRLRLSPQQKTINFRQALWINGLLDVVYIGVGYALYRNGKNERVIGSGVGVMIQGSFLFAFDWINYALTLLNCVRVCAVFAVPVVRSAFR
ncbi:MAG: hypothetical protein U5R06_06495 [candidate division KSB1 bacterium]|nr:hypothetical protein [candidate division KSB1 bacterium]